MKRPTIAVSRAKRAAVLSLLLVIPSIGFAQNTPVTRVIDGDTIEVDWHGELIKVRYIGIDTPELNDRRPEVRELAKAAKEANRNLVEGKEVLLMLDVEEYDRYGRVLAYVWAEGVFVNEALLRRGFAEVATYPPNVKFVDRLLEAQRSYRSEAANQR